jgi:hypothetical protein
VRISMICRYPLLSNTFLDRVSVFFGHEVIRFDFGSPRLGCCPSAKSAAMAYTKQWPQFGG